MTERTIKEKLSELAAAKGCRDPLSINIWTETSSGEIASEPGLFVPIQYRRADGGKRFKAQLGGNTRIREGDE